MNRPALSPLRPRDLLLLALMAFALLAPGIGSFPPVDRDEPRYAVATTQMLESGDYIDIRYQETPRYLQPVGIYWLQAASVATFAGGPEARAIWAHRLPSLLSAVAASVLTALIGASLFGRNAGLAAGVMMAACLSLGFEARNAKIDATLLLAITAAMGALAHLYLDKANRHPNAAAAAFWVALAAGVLLKGPIIAIVIAPAIVALCVFDRNARWLGRLKPLWGVPLMLAIVLPWYVAIGVHSDGLFYELAVGKSFLYKVGNSQQGHAGPIGYHTALFPLMFWPGSLFAALAAPFAFRNRLRPEVRFLLAWIVPTWIIFELVRTKLPHYVLPTYPALAMLAGAAFFSLEQKLPAQSPLWARIAGGAFAALWLACGLLAAALAPLAIYIVEHEVAWGAILPATLAGVAVVASLAFFIMKRRERALAAAAAAAFLIAANTYMQGLPGLKTYLVSPRIVAAFEQAKPCGVSTLVTTPFHEPSLVFLNGPRHTVLARSPTEAADALAQDVACTVAIVGEKQRPAFETRAAELGLTLRARGEVRGRNYADGDEDLKLTLFVGN